MVNMKNKFFIIISLIFAIFITGCMPKKNNMDTLDKIQQRGKLIIGVKYDTKPFGYIDKNGELTGFDIDLAKYIAKFILGDENKIEFKQVTPSNRISMLDSGSVDMVIATMSITKQRESVVDFSQPYYIAGQAILVPQNSKITSLSDLSGKKVIIIFGSTAETNIRLFVPDANIIGFKTYINGYNALKHGKGDAIATDDTILLGFADEDKSVRLLPRRYTKEPYAIGFKKGIDSDRLKTKVNFVLKTLISTGELDKLRYKWIKY